MDLLEHQDCLDYPAQWVRLDHQDRMVSLVVLVQRVPKVQLELLVQQERKEKQAQLEELVLRVLLVQPERRVFVVRQELLVCPDLKE